jgi:hypothetical protein
VRARLPGIAHAEEIFDQDRAEIGGQFAPGAVPSIARTGRTEARGADYLEIGASRQV